MSGLLKLDWIDILLHGAGAFGVMTAAALFGINPWIAAGANALAWFVREGWQAYKKGDDIMPTSWSIQKIVEAAAPAGVGVVMALQ